MPPSTGQIATPQSRTSVSPRSQARYPIHGMALCKHRYRHQGRLQTRQQALQQGSSAPPASRLRPLAILHQDPWRRPACGAAMRRSGFTTHLPLDRTTFAARVVVDVGRPGHTSPTHVRGPSLVGRHAFSVAIRSHRTQVFPEPTFPGKRIHHVKCIQTGNSAILP